ncbi:BMP family lipoprotein [Hahella sp. HN01]|uniref:BMP family lipoprotein n=1 Tax=unclassified Hahella TaxID=2624107 RepID=UPI001C1F1E11|nr:BMP family ABC transporter substrate-binding protein [Hahella sp. HN01]MBU6950716.1 BMP family ABC transporter substrate-binding protein [Hahella sp. HN01]
MKKTIIAACMGLTLVQPAIAADFKPAVVYDKAGKFDKSFNEAVFRGAEKFKKDTGVEVKEVEPTNEAQVEQGLEKLARRGSSPIVAVGFSQANAVSSVSAKYPDVQFTLIDMVVDNPNVHSIVFKEHEGSFLVGALAAMKSATGKVGFIGGMDIPLIRKFGCGFEQGAKYENPKAEVFTNMIGSTGAAFNNPGKAAELAKSQFDSGADVIFAAAGSSGSGVYQAAKDVGKYAIGVDSNQNHLHPGTMLTSMVKRVDVAAYSNWMAAKDGKWEPGVEALGLAENGVDWALDEHNRSLVTKEMEEKVNQIKADIISGKIKVHDYMSDNSCKY